MPPARSTRFPAVALPQVGLAADVPEAAVVAVPTTAVHGAARLAGEPPVDTAGLLERESAKGGAGELVSVPVTATGTLERVLLVGTGDGTQAAFQLVKTYGMAHAPWTRSIAKPVADFKRSESPNQSLGKRLVQVFGKVEAKVLPQISGDIGQVGLVLLREHHHADPRAAGTQHFFLHPANRQHPARKGDFPGHGHVVAHRNLGKRRD